MIRLSKMADYGIVLLTYVAQWGNGHLVTARDLAERSGLPLPTVSKVVKTLARGGLLKSHRGVHGGYSLARAAHGISVIDVVDAMEGPVSMTACTGGARARCSLLSTCPTRGAWASMNARVRDALATMTLNDMHGAGVPRPGRPPGAARDARTGAGASVTTRAGINADAAAHAKAPRRRPPAGPAAAPATPHAARTAHRSAP